MHATPRTAAHSDAALCPGLYGSRFAFNSSVPFARRLGFVAAPLDDFLVLHLVFGRTVPDVSRNGVSNLGRLKATPEAYQDGAGRDRHSRCRAAAPARRCSMSRSAG